MKFRMRSSLEISKPLLFLTWLVFSSSQLFHLPGSVAAEVDSSEFIDTSDTHGGEPWLESYQPHFSGLDRAIVGRAPTGINTLENNVPGGLNIEIGQTQHWVFPKEILFGPKAPATPSLPFLVKRRDRDALNDGDDVMLEEQINSGDQEASGIEPDGGANIRTVYITLNTCLQPSTNKSDIKTSSPQLELYASQAQDNQLPGPGGPGNKQTVLKATGGLARLDLEATGPVYLGVSAPATSDFRGIYNYEIAASIDAPYHVLNGPGPNLYLIDSDTDSALLITDNMTDANPDDDAYKQWAGAKPPFIMFAHNANESSIQGLESSYCGLKNHAQISAGGSRETLQGVDVSMTTRGLGNKPKQQFYIKGLNGSSSYYGFLAIQGNSTAEGPGVVGGGGMIWPAMNFKSKSGENSLPAPILSCVNTKSDGNCKVIYDLPFCSEVAYAVPSNPFTQSSFADFRALYDDHASRLYKNFSYALSQIQCETDPSSQYSLARTCADCAAAYKNWLCAVTIPRCEDYSSYKPYLKPRNLAQAFLNGSTFDSLQAEDGRVQDALDPSTNQSRNALIDTQIRPGPYKEIMPCLDLCHAMVQACPTALGFACPEGEWIEKSYRIRSKTLDEDGGVGCSYLGAAFHLSIAGGRLSVGWLLAFGLPVFLVLWVTL